MILKRFDLLSYSNCSSHGESWTLEMSEGNRAGCGLKHSEMVGRRGTEGELPFV